MKSLLVLGYLLIAPLICISQDSSIQNNDLADLSSLQSCDQLFNSAKSPIEKAELQKDYWTLLGVVSDLAHYRELFLREGKFINLFPTAYYHTTLSEMQRIATLNYTYPIEKMKQMIAFYDAYKWNREHWDQKNSNLVEKHWKEHFSYAEKNGTDVGFICRQIGYVLSSAIVAHVQCDLPRAIDYAYKTRFNKSLTKGNTELVKDFRKTDSIFPSTMLKVNKDVSNINLICPDKYLNIVASKETFVIMNNFPNDNIPEIKWLFNLKEVLTAKDVIYMRSKAWNQGMEGRLPFKGINGYSLLGQPVINHTQLIEKGKEICPPANDSSQVKMEETVVEPPIANTPSKSRIANSSLVGGSTEDALGRVLLRAIVTNNKPLWMSCVHPTSDWRDVIDKSFEEVRESLEEAGLTQWNLVKFSRVMYFKNSPLGGNDNGVVNGEQVRRQFRVEFTYKDEFVGEIENMTIITYKKKFFVNTNPRSFMRRF